ncbi:50S ribosomal protein L11 methyltransferase [Deinococcus irradiatisoli]|uniref:Ribosomal protein L11 methyltransferase n=1 Tax=Deinococcus irradiatisoli TaxID=2202254 RepID=A0A2Z3JQ42_9DEIO|nr:50S ribosomal protein L11 methyltransferase [Deinococcus irradiatisoli]AWN23114.1 50S ribosomal protein L11 methyltransferase [Deinococcus irradiatisoli]
MWVYVLSGTLESREAELDMLWEAGASGLEERAGTLRAYFEAPSEVALDGEWVEEPERDWQADWKKDLRPVTAGRFTIAPSWLRGEVPAGQLPLLIDPGMAFGTGHHATTRLAVEALGELDLTGLKVLDVGSGSGVLALAAALGGAAEVLGVDIDPLTLPAAHENAELNGLTFEQGRFTTSGGTLRFEEGSLDPDADDAAEYDLLVANLYAELHDLLAGAYRAVLRPGSPLILTGILQEKVELVRGALAREAFTDVTERLDGEWALITARSS